MQRSAAFLALVLMAAPAAHAQQAGCPFQDFGGFVTAFADDAQFQRNATAPVIIYSYLDLAADPEPATVMAMRDIATLQFPLMEVSKDRIAQGAETWVSHSDEGSTTSLTVRGPDGGYLVTWQFTASPCWTLTALVDEST